MNQEDLQQIKDVVDDTIGHHTKLTHEQIQNAMDAHMNSDQHRFVEGWMAKERRKTENLERIKGNAVFWLVVTAAGGVGTAIWQFVKRSLQE